MVIYMRKKDLTFWEWQIKVKLQEDSKRRMSVELRAGMVGKWFDKEQ